MKKNYLFILLCLFALPAWSQYELYEAGGKYGIINADGKK